MWMAHINSGSVTKLRASDGSVVGTYPAGPDRNRVAFDGASIWVTNYTTNKVSKL